MVRSIATYKGRSERYKGVYLYELKGQIKYNAGSGNTIKGFDTEREAAIYYDTLMISKGKEPVNILKRMQNGTT